MCRHHTACRSVDQVINRLMKDTLRSSCVVLYLGKSRTQVKRWLFLMETNRVTDGGFIEAEYHLKLDSVNIKLNPMFSVINVSLHS